MSEQAYSGSGVNDHTPGQLSGNIELGPNDFGPSGSLRIRTVELAYVMAHYSYDSELEQIAASRRLRHAIKAERRSGRSFRYGKAAVRHAVAIERLNSAISGYDTATMNIEADRWDAVMDYLNHEVEDSRLHSEWYQTESPSSLEMAS